MQFTKVQISELMRKYAEKGKGLHDLMEIMLESMMVAERGEFLRDKPDKTGCDGFMARDYYHRLFGKAN